MEDTEEEGFDDHFPGNAGFGAFDDDIPMEEPEVDVAENDPSDDLGQALHNVQADCAFGRCAINSYRRKRLWRFKNNSPDLLLSKSSIQKANSTMMEYLILTITANMTIYVYICN